jgi:hypothetical protein
MLLGIFSQSLRSWFAPLVLLAGVTLAPSVWSADGDVQETPQRTYVNSVSDFVMHTQAHIERVVTIGLDMTSEKMIQKFPEFAGIDRNLLRTYLRLHDKAKIEGWDQPGSIAEQLYQFYGKDFKKLTGVEKSKLEMVRDYVLKPRDDKISRDFLERNGLMIEGKLAPMGVLFERIAKIADQVDRVMCPVSEEEWGKIMEPASGSSWMPSEKDRRIARYYERPKLDRFGNVKRGADGRPILDRKIYEGLTVKKDFTYFKMKKLAQCIFSKIRLSNLQPILAH